MAMTGVRRMTTSLGLLERPPPERILPARRAEVVELSHWLFGAAAGAVFGAVVRPRAHGSWVGPAYGLAIWGGFEAAVAPFLGPEHPGVNSIASRLAVAADHVLYGVIVGGS